jgi:DNA-cytosine methyltransferase
VFGFPCQPFSPAGKGQGLDDPRGAVLKHCLDYVRRKRPLLVIAENSARLASRKFVDVRRMICNHLEDCGYRVHFTVLNTREQGLPQSRPRFYLVAFLFMKKPFSFPEKIDPVPLARLLEAPGAPAAGTTTHTCRALTRINAHVQAARHKLEAKGLRPEACDVVLDIGASAAWGHMMTDCSPCLTAQRCMQNGGHFLLRFNRLMTEKEVCRLQGIPDGRVDYLRAKVPKAKFLHAVGNAMSSNVLARILAHALPAAGLAKNLTPPSADDIFKYLVSA